MYPPTSKTQVRGPLAITHARNDPVPESLRFVTLMTVALAGTVPRPEPATVVVPNPTAPGKTGKLDDCAIAFVPISSAADVTKACTTCVVRRGVASSDALLLKNLRFIDNPLFTLPFQPLTVGSCLKVRGERRERTSRAALLFSKTFQRTNRQNELSLRVALACTAQGVL